MHEIEATALWASSLGADRSALPEDHRNALNRLVGTLLRFRGRKGRAVFRLLIARSTRGVWSTDTWVASLPRDPDEISKDFATLMESVTVSDVIMVAALLFLGQQVLTFST